MNELNLFVPLTKVDAAKRLVYGTIAEEVLDRSGEVFDYASSRPYFETWSGECRKVSDGKSVGNLRAMHGHVAAGKLVDIAFDDAAKKIEAVAKVVDDDEWRKCEEGVYTGFSVGGAYARKWVDPATGARRYTCKPKEVSLADRPCIPTATFTLVKADGTEETRTFQSLVVSGQSLATSDKPLATDSGYLKKSMYDVSQLAGLLSDLNCIRRSLAEASPGPRSGDAQAEGDGSEIPAKLRDAINGLAEILIEMAVEETSELTAPGSVPGDDIDSPLEGGLGGVLRKSGARHSKGDIDKIQAIHDHAAGLGADCSGMAKTDKANPQMTQIGTDEGDEMEEAKLKEFEERLAKLDSENADLKERLEKIEAAPEAPKVALRAIGKGEDISTAADTAPPEPLRKADGSIDHEATALEQIKFSHRNPQLYKI